MTSFWTQDSGTLYLGEMNPRITGVTPLTNQAAREQHQPPLLLFHLLEWMGIDFSLDIDEFNQRFVEAGPAANWSQLIIEHIRDQSETLTKVPVSGVWCMQPDGGLSFVRQAFQTQAAADESEAFFMRTIDAGHTALKGSSVGTAHAARPLDGRRLSPHRPHRRMDPWIQTNL